MNENDKKVNVNIINEMKTSFLDYSMSVIVSRALPDVRDGLKPVHRRILYTLYEEGMTPDKKHQKSANAVGAVMGHYHPHEMPQYMIQWLEWLKILHIDML